ncbi:MAG: hypothetical protein V4697_04090 [Patescibacteria group bacterium]
MEILAKLFGGLTKVKLLRLFLFNPESAYPLKEIVLRTKSDSREVKKEVSELVKLDVVRKRAITLDITKGKGKKVTVKKVQEEGYYINPRFPYLQALKNLLITVSLHADDTLVKKFTSVGRLKLFIASGLFIQEWDTRVDLLIVGDELKLEKLDAVIKTIESEIGKEISYSAFETTDFEYRLGIHDRLIRDILDSPHATLVDKIGIEEKQ